MPRRRQWGDRPRKSSALEAVPVLGVWHEAVPDEPLEDLVAEERELPTTCRAVRRNNSFPGPRSDYLLTRG